MISTQTETKTPPVSGPSRRRWIPAVVAVAVTAAVAVVLTVTPILGSLGNVSIVAGWFPGLLVLDHGRGLRGRGRAPPGRAERVRSSASRSASPSPRAVRLAAFTQAVPAGAPQVPVRLADRGVPDDRAWCSPGGAAPAGPAGSPAWSPIVLALVSAGSAANQTFDYYPTFDRLFGKSANNFLDNSQLDRHAPGGGQDRQAPRPRRHAGRDHPRHGLKFTPRQAYVWVPPGVVRARSAQAAGHRADARHARRALRLDPSRLRRRHVAGLRRAAPRGGADPGHAGHQRVVGRGLRMRRQRDVRDVETYLTKTVPRTCRRTSTPGRRPGSFASPVFPRAACAPP